MISFFSTSLVAIGLLIHIATLAPLCRLVLMLPAGSLRNKWLFMGCLIATFIAGYLGYIVIIWGRQSEWVELLFPGILLFGAVFVWQTISLSLQTAADLQRISLLESENITDSLTKVYNRRYLDRRLEEEVARAKRYALDLSITMIDIDHFKLVNDTYGHQAGDVVLSEMCSLIKADVRDLDMVARYGGEEFLVICTNTPIAGAALVAERLRQLVESSQIEVTDGAGVKQILRISISLGVAGFSAQLDSQEKLIQAADHALYRAKSEGRNRVAVAGA
ncbi:MAG: diguanylate cyclase [Gallionella sp.]|nr:diguanylate cyclase [Gallionella sp.]